MFRIDLLKRTDLDSYQKLIVMMCFRGYLGRKRWLNGKGPEIIEKVKAKTDWKNKVDEVFKTIYPAEAEVLNLRYGLEDGKQKTCREVGFIRGVTGSRIQQIEARALRKLEHPSRSRSLGLKELF
jgi:DNA-directed RNA polymerase sigma subunit (sigma70/sigma32)